MSNSKGERYFIGMDQLCIGLHIKLDSWLGHPFLVSSFKIKDQKQIDALRSMGLKEIEYLPQKSSSKPLSPSVVATPDTTPNEPDESTIALEELMQEKKERIENLAKERKRIQAAEKKYVKTANAVKNVMRQAMNNPAQAVEQSNQIAVEMADLFISDNAPYIHLMGENVADESDYFHGLNVTVLSLILARSLGINNPELMRDIAQGAVLHDVGKAMVPSQVLMKNDYLTTAESKLLQMHPGYGIKLMLPVDSLSRQVREIIFFHHEMIDGSGFPKGLKGDAISQAVRIVTTVNAYDNLCNQRVVKLSKTPSEALSFMYKNELAKYDKTVLSAFIKSLGVYPPGTIVVLKSGRVGIVMSVDSSDLLHPNVMLYDAEIPKEDAAIVNLRRDLDDAIDRTLRPSALPQAIHDYLSPRKRICYFVDNDGAG